MSMATLAPNTAADRIARAVLYEGYILYPYRATSVKNRQRWTFGGIYPRDYSEAQGGSDPCQMRAQCLLTSDGSATVTVAVRFLHLLDRAVERADGGTFRRAESLDVAGRTYQCWQEAGERSVDLGEVALAELEGAPRREPFTFAGSCVIESLGDAGRLVRVQQQIHGVVEVTADRVADGVHRLTVRVTNDSAPSPGTPGAGGGEGAFERRPAFDAQNHRHPNPLSAYRGREPEQTRDAALLQSFASTHMILGTRGGAFASPTDPPAPLQDLAATCHNVGCWPVLVGDAGQTDALLVSPIILYDYPQVAPESPGDLFDGCEIDEILTLRILTMTDAEKREAAAIDPMAADLLARTEALAREQMMDLHGAMRDVMSPMEGA